MLLLPRKRLATKHIPQILQSSENLREISLTLIAATGQRREEGGGTLRHRMESGGETGVSLHLHLLHLRPRH